MRVVVVVPELVRSLAVPTTTAVPSLMPLLISAREELMRPTVTATDAGCPEASRTWTVYVPSVAVSRAIAGTARTSGAEAVVTAISALMPGTAPFGASARVTTMP